MKLFNKMDKELSALWQDLKDPLLWHYTGSMFGIGCDARSIDAVQKISRLKNRRENSGYIVLVDSFETLKKYNPEIDKKLEGLIKQYSPGGLTVVLPCIQDDLQHLAVDNKIAFRIPAAPLLRKFLSTQNIPLVSTSINRSKEKPQTDYRYIMRDYIDWFDLALLPDNELVAPKEPSTIITLKNERLQCLREGIIPFYQLQEDYEQPVINFMCTGNICRSPLAEYYFRYKAEQAGLHWRAISSGTMQEGLKISENSRILLADDGIDPDNHRSQKISRELIQRSRLVLTMAKRHKQAIKNTDWKTDHVYTLAEFAGKNYDIDDPYMQPLEEYSRIYDQIKYLVDIVIDKLLEGKY